MEDIHAGCAALMRAGAHVVKLEGGEWLRDSVAKLSDRGVPVCVHLGLTPQSVNKFGGYKVQGRDPAERKAKAPAGIPKVERKPTLPMPTMLPPEIPTRTNGTPLQPPPCPVDWVAKTIPPPKQAEMQMGQTCAPAAGQQHRVRCLGCRQTLSISQWATLVNCPDCSTISPATSTRR